MPRTVGLILSILTLFLLSAFDLFVCLRSSGGICTFLHSSFVHRERSESCIAYIVL